MVLTIRTRVAASTYRIGLQAFRPSPSRSPVRRHLEHSATAFRPIKQPCFISIILISSSRIYLRILIWISDPLESENSSIPRSQNRLTIRFRRRYNHHGSSRPYTLLLLYSSTNISYFLLCLQLAYVYLYLPFL